MTRRKADARQLLLFSGNCPLHGPGNVCELCPEKYDTDGYGFPGPNRLQGREPLRMCQYCGQLTTRANWHVFKGTCKQCASLLVE